MESLLSSLLQLEKSGIECVILAGSSLFTLSAAKSRYGSGLASSSWRTDVIFSRILTVLHLKSHFLLARRGISRFRGVPRGPEGKVEEGGSGFSPERGQISREISGNVFFSKGSDFQRNF